MNLVLNILSSYLLISAGMTGFFAVYSFVKIKSELAKLFSLFCASIAVYLFGYLIELNSTVLNQMLFWNQVQYVGVPFISAIWILLTIKYFKSKYVLKPIVKSAIFLIPVLTFFIHLTNQFHHFYYSKTELSAAGLFPVLFLGKGPWYIVQFTFVTLCFLISTYLFLTRLRHPESTKRTGVILMIFSSVFLWIGILINVLNFGSTGLDFAAFIFPVSCLLLFVSIFRYEFLSLIPLALEKVFESTNNAIIVLNEKNCIIDYNHYSFEIFTELNKDIIGKPIGTILHEYQVLTEAVNNRKNIQFTISKNNSDKYYYAAISDIYTSKGTPAGFILILTDITDHKKAEIAIATSENRLKRAQSLAHVGNWELDTVSNQIWASDEAFRIYGINQDSYYIKLETIQGVVNKEDRPRLDRALKLLLERNEIYDIEFRINRADSGEERVIHSNAAAEFNDNNEPVKVTGVIRDVTDRKKGEEEILYLSYHDQLTGMYNLRFYEEELKRLDTKRNLPITLVMADVNGLKLTNDAFGHMEGDKLLIKVGELIKGECRSDDILARIGGDEFIILLPKTNLFEADKIVQRINEKIKNTAMDKIIVSVSFGSGTKQNLSEQIGTVFKKAEDNMYKNKLSDSTRMKTHTINIILNTLFEKNKRERKHSERVSHLCERFGVVSGFNEQKISELKALGLMHDIGKIGLSESLLNSKAILSDLDWIEMKRHSEIGYRILSSLNEYSQIAEYVLAHHERWDGKGYPKGLKNEDIPFESRIVAAADSYETMTGESPYREALSKASAAQEIAKNAGSQFDPGISKIFVEKVLEEKWMPDH
jgi:diguanylate cyclase (GGDEF)-like protein/PAS domain S-box-containing protein